MVDRTVDWTIPLSFTYHEFNLKDTSVGKHFSRHDHRLDLIQFGIKDSVMWHIFGRQEIRKGDTLAAIR
jgi:hypothetical protein